MATGYTAPKGTLIHRMRTVQVGAIQVQELWCGIRPDLTRWTVHEATEPTCPRCITAWERHLAEQAPFGPGETVRYTQHRHPGLINFSTAYGTGNKLAGWAWRVNGAPRTHWRASRDYRAPAERPIQLGVGGFGVEPIGYHTTVLAAVEWTKILTLSGSLLPMYRALRAGLWDPYAENLPLSDTASGATKETNPA